MKPQIEKENIAKKVFFKSDFQRKSFRKTGPNFFGCHNRNFYTPYLYPS